MGIYNLYDGLTTENVDGVSVTAKCFAIGVIFLGFWGSYKNNVLYLLIFSVVLFVAVAVAFLRDHYYIDALDLLVLILPVVQIVLIRKGYA